jgi:hypothetical protein
MGEIRMVWEKLTGTRGLKIQPGKFAAVSMGSALHVPAGMRNKQATWYIDSAKKVARLTIEDEGFFSIKETASMPKKVKELINEDQAVVYCDEEEENLFIGSYKAGQESLKKFI